MTDPSNASIPEDTPQQAEDTPEQTNDTTMQTDDVSDDIDWAAAMAEQAAGTQAQAAARAEQEASAETTAKQATSAATVADNLFKPLVSEVTAAQADIEMIKDIPVQLSVELGRTRLTIRNILELGQGSVVELDGLAGEPMDIYVNGYLIAQGEVVVVDDNYGIRVTDIITPSDRINRLRNRR